MNSSSTRQDFADELRGFALLGIVVVNAPFLGISGLGFTEASVAATGDRLAALLTVALAQAKFYLLFAFLFGYSMSFLVRTDDAGSRMRFLRRLLGLAVLGVLHSIGLFVGDILLLYGLLGTALLLLRTWSVAALLRFAAAVGVLWVVVLGLLVVSSMDTSQNAFVAARVAAFDAAMVSGTFGQAAAARLEFWPMAWALIGLLNGLPVLAMFALGLLAGRQRLLADPDPQAPMWRRGRRLGTALGLPVALVGAWLSVGPGAQLGMNGLRETLGVVLGFVSAPLLSWAYVGWLLRWRQGRLDGLRWFRPAGRMSLSGYLGESLLLSLLFCGYGAGLFGQLGAAAVAVLGLLVWGALDLLAHVMERHAARGPAEWLLRWISGPRPGGVG